MGILLAVSAIVGLDLALQGDFFTNETSFLPSLGALAILGLTVFALLGASVWRKSRTDEK